MSAATKPPGKQSWFTGIAQDKAFAKLLKIISESSDSRDFYDILEKYPDLVNRQDKDGRTPLMYAAMKGHTDVMVTLIEVNKADVSIRDKKGKDVSDYVKDYATEEIQYLTNRYKDYPKELEREVRDVKENQDYILKMIETLKGSKDVAALRQTTKDIDRPGGPIPFVGKVGSFLTGEEPTSLKGQLENVREQTGRSRKTRKTRKGKGKGRKSRRRV